MLTFSTTQKTSPVRVQNHTSISRSTFDTGSGGGAAWDMKRYMSSGDERGVLVNYGAYHGCSVRFGGFFFSFLLSMSWNASVASTRRTPVAVVQAIPFRTGLGSALVFCNLCYRS